MTLIILVIGVYLVAGLARQVWTTIQNSQRLNLAQDRLKVVDDENTRLGQEIKKLSSDQYVEEQARNQLGLAKPGETVVVLPNDQNNKHQEPAKLKPTSDLPNWYLWWRLFFEQ